MLKEILRLCWFGTDLKRFPLKLMYHHRGRGRGYGGHGRGRGDRGSDGWKERHAYSHDAEDGDTGEGDEGSRSNRPPPGLKGRAIGMWYAQRSRGKKKQQEKMNRPVVSMEVHRERHIRQLLDNISATDSFAEACQKDASPFDDRFPPSTASTSRSNHGNGAVASAVSPTTADSQSEVEDVPMDDVPSISELIEFEKAEDEYPIPECVDVLNEEFAGCMGDNSDPALDKKYRMALLDKQTDQKYRHMLEFRKKLPSYNMKEEILQKIQNNQVLVISGETGCGKTTQVPQFILDDYIQSNRGSQCRILCTQPRRISAISVAERVASERCESCGGNSSVGYQIRLEYRLPRRNGSILYCTTGIVLKFLESDPYLKRATHVILDEIHERDLQSDFLMIILKDLLPRRPDLKVILMSATLNAEMFSKYFFNSPMLNIPGYTFPVEEYLLEDVVELLKYTPQSEKRPQRRQHHQRHNRGEYNQERDEEQWNYEVWCRNLKGDYSDSTIRALQVMDFSKVDLDLIAALIRHICLKDGEGAILVFVPGWAEISKLNKQLTSERMFHSNNFRIIPLHSLMPTVNQKQVFERPPPGVRKIIIATNIAETSITIDDVVFVIDCGKIKVKDFQPQNNLSTLESKWVSKANSKQRKGRAGRVQAGKCYHLYTSLQWNGFQDYLLPEILRTRLEELCLQIKLLKLGKITPFVSKAMQPPSMESLERAIVTLQNLNALDRDENLLPLGYHLARMPVDPQTGKMILFGAMFCCLDPILTVAASLSFKDAFIIPLGKESDADRARKRLSENSMSDHLMLVNAFQGWEESQSTGNDRNYCWENFLSENTLKLLRDMKRQLAELLHDLGFLKSKLPHDPSSNLYSDNQGLLKAVLCAGLYPNVAKVHKCPKPNQEFKTVALHTKSDGKAHIHPKSVNAHATHFASKWIVYYHKLKTAKIYVHDCTMVSPYPLLFFGGEITIGKDGDQDIVGVDDWIVFRASPNTAQLVKDLRSQLDRLLEVKVTHPGPTNWNTSGTEGAIMKAISDLITTEDNQSNPGRRDLPDGSFSPGSDHDGSRSYHDGPRQSSHETDWDSRSHGRSSHKTNRDYDDWSSGHSVSMKRLRIGPGPKTHTRKGRHKRFDDDDW
ncbi:ATP-dependent DNA/RNA helicase DHX36-like isoform X2 [Gigantopelta aegis]|uniref:ATP-dependent DNA/RNA helicase DHX36-like isoform X2 n=1 Tax=Gigantopelta aegis TaxID=1735272 RepID=UPI001B8873F9|nr:ATP-dependent DNA/RNA helicase DHX36-like isoform X2 [Gigantopelta aegis]